MKVKEYCEIIEHYTDLEAKKLSEQYLEKYWLTSAELLNFWIPIKNRIFCSDSKDLPDLMFNENFVLKAQRGGVLFTQPEYYAFQNCMKIAGDKYFVILENEFVRDSDADFPHLRFKFSVDTTWEMLNNGNEHFPDISYETLYIMNKHFFVFGDNGMWGKYVASNYKDTPLDIIGFKPELATFFQEYFVQQKKEQKNIKSWLPNSYEKLIK